MGFGVTKRSRSLVLHNLTDNSVEVCTESEVRERFGPPRLHRHTRRPGRPVRSFDDKDERSPLSHRRDELRDVWWIKTRNAVGERVALVIPERSPRSFLSDIPDSVPLSALILPGTHDTMALYGWALAQCQSTSTPLERQLLSGIRVVDIRLSLVDGALMAYHSIIPQRATFASILSTLHAFLASPEGRRETVVVSIKQEDFRRTPPPRFSIAVRDEMEKSIGGGGKTELKKRWFLTNRVPTLGEVRGRCVLFSRFGGDGNGWEGALEGMGIHPTTWPDSSHEGFDWTCKDTLVRTHDWYGIPSFLSIPEKAALATQILIPPDDRDTPNGSGKCLNLTYLSASSLPLAPPPVVARGLGWPRWGMGFEGVNTRTARWLTQRLVDGDQSSEKDRGRGARVRGWVMMDFYEEPAGTGLVPLLIEMNFHGRRSGEEGWP